MLNLTTFKPAWWLRNCHLQTIYPALLRKPPTVPQLWRERIITPDGDFLDLDYCGTGDGPLVIMLHGLTGSSESGYIKGLQIEFLRRGWRSVVMNFRGCSGEPNNKARSYHSGETEDLQFIYETLRQREPETRFAAIGFSLGGNVLLKWLGEQGGRVRLSAAVAVSVPLLLNLCATKLDKGFSKLYRANLLAELKAYMSDKLAHLARNGLHAEAAKIRELGDCTKITSFWQYDNIVVAVLFGFKDVHDYYQRASSRQFLRYLQVPTLIIQADDDPFMTPAVLPTHHELSAHVQLEVTRGGGHVGFVTCQGLFKPRYWLEERIPAFLQLHW